jgi:hypothetical protein
MTHESRDRTAAESSDNISAESRDHVLATYREIAERFRLGSSNAARTKVKRARWTWESPNHPADPLRIRVPKEAWDQAAESPPRNQRPSTGERRDSKPRHPPSQADESWEIKGFERALDALQEQLERERARADASETRVRELMTELDTAREKEARLREERAAVISKAEAAEAQVDDLKAEARKEGEGRTKAEARAELLQTENEKLRAEAVRADQVNRAEGPRRRRWRFWGRRG